MCPTGQCTVLEGAWKSANSEDNMVTGGTVSTTAFGFLSDLAVYKADRPSNACGVRERFMCASAFGTRGGLTLRQGAAQHFHDSAVIELDRASGEEPLTVLLLGLGGNVSQGILKALRLCSLPIRIVGACVSPTSAGLYASDRALISPPVADAGFDDWLVATCQDEKVDVVLSGVEPILAAIAQRRSELEQATSATLLVSAPEVLAIGDDKFLTCNWLRDSGLNSPRCVLASDAEGLEMLLAEAGLPLIAKPRYGRGGQGVFMLSTMRDLDLIAGLPMHVVQECLGSAEEEYTIGCWSDLDGDVRGCIVMRRELTAGTTTAVTVESCPPARDEAVRIANALRPMGPCNIQMRVTEGRAVCFEVNVRFSGTTPMRARLGFNDVEATLRHYVLGEPAVDLPLVTTGYALRLWREVYPTAAAVEQLNTFGALDDPAAFTNSDDGWIAR
jgi:carbamoyl-phosphate synthase large subunit